MVPYFGKILRAAVGTDWRNVRLKARTPSKRCLEHGRRGTGGQTKAMIPGMGETLRPESGKRQFRARFYCYSPHAEQGLWRPLQDKSNNEGEAAKKDVLTTSGLEVRRQLSLPPCNFKLQSFDTG